MSYQSVVLADNPALFLTLNDLAGNFTDLSPNGLNFTPNGTITRGVPTGFAGLGAGITFGGTIADYLSHLHSGLLDAAITWEVWVKWAATPSGASAIASQGFTAGAAGYLYYLAGADESQNVDAQTAGDRHEPGPPGDNAWHYIAMSNLTGTFTHCVDGATGTFSAAPTVGTSSEPYTIGARSNNGAIDVPYNGSMSNIALYPNALSAAQMIAHYAARNDGPAPVVTQPQIILPGSVSAALRV